MTILGMEFNGYFPIAVVVAPFLSWVAENG